MILALWRSSSCAEMGGHERILPNELHWKRLHILRQHTFEFHRLAHPGYTPIVCASVRYIQSPQDLYPTTSSLAMLWHAACFISHALVVVVIEPNISRHLNCHGDSWSMCRKLPQHIFLESSCFPRCISQSFHCPTFHVPACVKNLGC